MASATSHNPEAKMAAPLAQDPTPQLAEPMTQEPSDSAKFFRAATYNEAYWDDYMAARAKYSPEFYGQTLAYHRTHNPSPSEQTVVHDIGTGPGQVAAELYKHFPTVYASDTNATHLAVAATHLEKARLKDRVTWMECGAEGLSSIYPPASASLLTVAECLPLLDVPKAMSTFAHLLQPDGTPAVWFYGRPAFSEPEYVEVSDFQPSFALSGACRGFKALLFALHI